MNNFKLQLDNTYRLIEGIKQYDFKQCIAYILERGKKLYGETFLLTKYQKEALYQLLIYAIEDRNAVRNYDLDIHKGLLLMGAPSTGKTALMHLTKAFYPRKKQYDIKTCRALSQEFMQKGFEALSPYESLTSRPICLDNLGKEHIARHYGYTCEVVNSIVESHYEQRMETNFPRLHITTSLSPTEIEDRYGGQFRRMLQQMFNVIVFKS